LPEHESVSSFQCARNEHEFSSSEVPESAKRGVAASTTDAKRPERPLFAELRLTGGGEASREAGCRESGPEACAGPDGIEVVLTNGRLLRVRRRSDLELLLAVANLLEREVSPC
jgi:hypothetical protein